MSQRLPMSQPSLMSVPILIYYSVEWDAVRVTRLPMGYLRTGSVIAHKYAVLFAVFILYSYPFTVQVNWAESGLN